MEDCKIAVVALGGNAIEDPSIDTPLDQQQQAAYGLAEKLICLLNEGYRLVITHGNGPQVGNVMMGMEQLRAMNMSPPPLDQCVAMTQGSIGYLLENNLSNVLLRSGNTKHRVISLLTEVEVDQKDPAFQHPVKGVGHYITANLHQKLLQETDWVFKKNSQDGLYRRVVPSPRPIRIFIHDIIKSLLQQGFICIAGGGGGIPLYQGEEGEYHPVEAVVDKDLTSSLLAQQLKADIFIIATAVNKVCLNFGKENEQMLDEISLKQLNEYIKEGHFGEGTMLPKVQAIQEYMVGNEGKSEAFILNLKDLENFRTAGTRFYKN